ncbi:MAG: alkaline phosphatase family protein [Pseudomonadota bacterium]
MAAIELAAGGPGAGTAPLAALPVAALAGTRSLVLLIIDGLGSEYLAHASPAGPLSNNLLGDLQSVCPATTAAAVTTFFTGRSPASHGLLGWFTPFEARDEVVLPLLAQARNGRSLPASDLATLYRSPPLAARLARECHVVTARRLVGSAYSRHHAGPAQVHGYRSLGGLFGQLEHLLRADGPPRYVHAYWPQLDKLAHEHGIGHRRTREHLREIEAQLARFLKTIAGTDALLLVTSDHGFVDIAPERRLLLNDHPALVEQLRLPLAGESRLAFVHARPDARDALGVQLAAFLGERGHVQTGRQFIDAGHFGPGEPHPALAQRVGDFVIAMADGWSLRDRLPGEQPFSPVGVHGGLSDAERRVPLAVFEA